MVKIRKIASIEKGIEEVLKILNEDEIMDITVKILESMSIFSTGVCRNIARRIETFNNANQ